MGRNPCRYRETYGEFLPADRGKVIGGLPDVVTIMEGKVRWEGRGWGVDKGKTGGSRDRVEGWKDRRGMGEQGQNGRVE